MKAITWPKQKTRACAHIRLIALPDARLDAPLLWREILDADRLDPWKMLTPQGLPAPSIRQRELASINGKEPCEHDPKRMVSTSAFVIEPSFPLSSGQIPAYYEYVTRLVDNLRGRNLVGVASIGISLSFKVEYFHLRTSLGDDAMRRARAGAGTFGA